MPSNAPRPEDHRGRILPFRRGGKPRPGISDRPEQDTPVKGVEQYASVGEPDNYRQRMINNGLALGTGVWSVSASIFMIKGFDPLVLFGGLGYTHEFARDFQGR